MMRRRCKSGRSFAHRRGMLHSDETRFTAPEAQFDRG